MNEQRCVICGTVNGKYVLNCKKCGFPLDVLQRKPEQKAKIYSKAARKGYRVAQFNLGLQYEKGTGVPQNYTEAAKYFRMAADQGMGSAQLRLGVFYEYGRGVEQNYTEAAKWYRKAAEQGLPTAQYTLALLYAAGKGVPRDYYKAVRWYNKAAEQGDADAMNNLGNCYKTGNGVPVNYEEAMKYYRKSADKNNPFGQYNIGLLYEDGKGVPQNYSEAARWYSKAAEQGHKWSQFALGKFYENGLGVTKNSAEAVRWYRKSAEQGHSDALNNLGNCYKNGNGIPKNYEEAAKLYRKAAEQNNASSQYNLGLLYENGHGVPQNYQEAVKWYRLAAEQGHQWAQYNLGLLYEKGHGVPQNYQEAVKWYRKAADQGCSYAQNDLGVCFKLGRGVAVDYAEAYKWIRKAAEQNNRNAQYNLGFIFKNGQSVPQSYEEAARWFQKAADQGFEKAKTVLEELKKAGYYPPSENINKNGKETIQKLAENLNLVASQKKPEQKPLPASQNQSGEETVESLLLELNSLIGLNGVKKEVQNRINRLRIAQSAGELGSKRVFHPGTLHMVFTGNPGTGKTTVARLIGKLYGKLGVLKNPDVFVECGRDDLVAPYVGQTAPKVKAKFEEAKGGILFIDEAYSLYKPGASNDFGQEAIDTMVQYMDTMREDILVIVAGYRNEMEAFIREANPGLASRFRTTINFEDYTPEELSDIFKGMVKKDGMTLDQAAEKPLKKVIEKRSKKTNFGNARGIRNLFEDIKETHDSNLADMVGQGVQLNADVIDCITAKDVECLLDNGGKELPGLEELFEKLDAMVGLRAVKQQLRKQVAIVQAQLNAEKAGVTTLKGIGPQHMIFAGNPGTGKTTVARLVGEIYEALGLVADSSIFVECGRADLVGQYIGQTAPKVQEKVRSALGGILFIDEAYSLYQGDGKDFGQEAISELVREMENHRDNLIVILAGYSEDMRNMISNANAGLKSRFPVWLDFEDYSVAEMVQIFQSMLKNKGYQLKADSAELEKLITERSAVPDFGNGRGVRNLVDEVIAAQSLRLVSAGESIEDPSFYTEITDDDLQAVMKQENPYD